MRALVLLALAASLAVLALLHAASASVLTRGMVLRVAEEAPWMVVPAPDGGLIVDCRPVYIYLPPSGAPRVYWVKWGLTEAEAEMAAYECVENALSAMRASALPLYAIESAGMHGVQPPGGHGPPSVGGGWAGTVSTSLQAPGIRVATPSTVPRRHVVEWLGDASFVAAAVVAGLALYLAARRL